MRRVGRRRQLLGSGTDLEVIFDDVFSIGLGDDLGLAHFLPGQLARL